MTYDEYMRSTQWKSLRYHALFKARFTCQGCGAYNQPDNVLKVHHKRYPARYEDDSLDNLCVLCDKCHAKAHGLPHFNDRPVTIAQSIQLIAAKLNQGMRVGR